jgi:hypothetical protein
VIGSIALEATGGEPLPQTGRGVGKRCATSGRYPGQAPNRRHFRESATVLVELTRKHLLRGYPLLSENSIKSQELRHFQPI